MLTTTEPTHERIRTARALVEHIISEHHRFSFDCIARIRPLFSLALTAHGRDHPELEQLAQAFAHVAADLESHQMREEQVLFPAILALEDGGDATLPFPITHPIARMTADHDSMRERLRWMAALTRRYQAPADASPTWYSLYRELATLDRDLQVHSQLENEVLFPRALALACR